MVHEYLGTGLDTATTRNELTGVLGLKRRPLTRAIEKERKAGFPICASVNPPFGYFMPENREELSGYIRSLDHRIREMQRTRDALEDALGRWF